MDAIQRFTENIVCTTYETLPASALAATKTFILDTLGVCVAGSTAPGVSALVKLLRCWGGTPESSLCTYGGKLPAPWAAMANSVMMHNLEFDCVHDLAVVHPFTTALPAALAVAEAQGGVSGKTLLTAVTVGVDTSTRIGMSSRARMRFFRPGVCGAFGATAAVAKVMGCNLETTTRAMGLVYSQLCGTLQSHHDGRQYSKRLDAVLGSPEKPLSRTAHLHKFRRCWQHGGQPTPAGNADRIIDLVEHLEDVSNIGELCRLLVPSPL